MQTQAPHSMIWLGFCLGMATEGMYAPLQAQGVEAMIGFSEAVTVDADHAYRAALCTALLRDCTLAEAAATMKEQVGLHDPYQTGHAPAYPIAVSSQDAYPGRNHLTEGQQVCSTWKLYPPYPINVVVEPADSADVHVTRTNLEISPHRGYRFADWALSGEGASGVRSDNRLELRLTGPCTVTLRMEARTPASLHFSTAPGQSAQDFQEFVGDSVELPAPEGTPEADAFVYHFIGWSREPIPGSSQERPELLAAGSRLTLTQPETVLYAVYGYFAPEDGCSAGQFRLLTEAPEDWAGDYVISYQSSRFLWGGSRFTGQAIASPSAAARLAVTGCFVDGEYLNEVPEDLVYSFLPTDDGSYLLKMTSGKHYLTVPGSSVMLSTTEDPGAVGAAWRLNWSNGAALITNAKYNSRYLQFSLTGSCFCTLTALRSSLSLYARVPGLHLYTTEPRSSQPKPELPCSDDAHCPGRIFTDLPARGHWAHDAIDWAALTGVSTGTGANRFSPQQRCTRAQIVTFLWRAAGAPAPAGAQCAFPDVQPGAYYEQAVQWAWEQDIAFGTEEGLFRPNDSCTREQAVSFLWRCAGSPAPQSGDCPFDDLKPESYARSAVLWAAEQGIAESTGAACFRPAALCTRAQIAALLYRAVRLGLL